MRDTIVEAEIEGIAGVYQAVGFETSFHDAEILSITLDRSSPDQDVNPTLVMTLWTPTSRIPGEAAPDAAPWYRISLEFYWIDELVLQGFNHQNVIGCITVKPQGDRFKIDIENIFGVDLSFSYRRARIVSIEGAEYPRPKTSI
jgi:hypothetical protein